MKGGNKLQIYSRMKFLASVLQVNGSEVRPTFLHPPGSSKCFMYPSLQEMLWVGASKSAYKSGSINCSVSWMLSVKRNSVVLLKNYKTGFAEWIAVSMGSISYVYGNLVSVFRRISLQEFFFFAFCIIIVLPM